MINLYSIDEKLTYFRYELICIYKQKEKEDFMRFKFSLENKKLRQIHVAWFDSYDGLNLDSVFISFSIRKTKYVRTGRLTILDGEGVIHGTIVMEKELWQKFIEQSKKKEHGFISNTN